MVRLLLALLCCLALATPAWAGYDEGLAAYERGDYKTATRELKLSAEQGDARAQVLLGGLYIAGRGVLQDHAEGLKWFRKAAEQGSALASFTLGAMYILSRPVTCTGRLVPPINRPHRVSPATPAPGAGLSTLRQALKQLWLECFATLLRI